MAAATPFSGANTSRRQIAGRFDHYFNERNKLGVSYTYELTYSDGTLSLRTYPQSVDGHTYRRPQIMTANFTSTLSPNLVNEARVGLRRTAGQDRRSRQSTLADAAAIARRNLEKNPWKLHVTACTCRNANRSETLSDHRFP